MKKEINISGEKFNRLTAVRRSDCKNSIKWIFTCDCGKEVESRKSMVVLGKIKSCGCISKELSDKANKYKPGSKFNMLTVIKRSDKINSEGKRKHLICKCDCGNIKEVGKKELRNGDTKSCGCLAKSLEKFKENEVVSGVKVIKVMKGGDVLVECKCGNEFIKPKEYFSRVKNATCNSCKNTNKIEEFKKSNNIEVGSTVDSYKVTKIEMIERSLTIQLKCECGRTSHTNNIGKIKKCVCHYNKSMVGTTKGIITIERNIKGTNDFIASCECGNTIELKNLKKSQIPNHCGCIKKSQHGMTNTKFYRAFGGMKSRCSDKSRHNYHRYGGRGITVCKEWKNDFMNFYNDMHKEYESHSNIYGEDNTTLDRIDNNKGYSKENCRWATYKVQNNNKKQHNT